MNPFDFLLAQKFAQQRRGSIHALSGAIAVPAGPGTGGIFFDTAPIVPVSQLQITAALVIEHAHANVFQANNPTPLTGVSVALAFLFGDRSAILQKHPGQNLPAWNTALTNGLLGPTGLTAKVSEQLFLGTDYAELGGFIAHGGLIAEAQADVFNIALAAQNAFLELDILYSLWVKTT